MKRRTLTAGGAVGFLALVAGAVHIDRATASAAEGAVSDALVLERTI